VNGTCYCPAIAATTLTRAAQQDARPVRTRCLPGRVRAGSVCCARFPNRLRLPTV